MRDEPTRSILVGFDFNPVWPLATLMLGGFLLGFPTLKASLVYWATATACLALTACLRGFRLEVSRRGFVHWWTWAGIPYWRVTARLDAQVSLTGEFGGTDEQVVIERVALDECIALGSSATCAALHRAILTAQARWTDAPAGSDPELRGRG